MTTTTPIGLPDRPLTTTEAHALTQHEQIEYASPMLGLNPTPTESVVGLYVGLPGRGNLFGYATIEDETWTKCGAMSPDALRTGEYTQVFEEFMDWLNRHNPDQTLTLLENQNRSLP